MYTTQGNSGALGAHSAVGGLPRGDEVASNGDEVTFTLRSWSSDDTPHEPTVPRQARSSEGVTYADCGGFSILSAMREFNAPLIGIRRNHVRIASVGLKTATTIDAVNTIGEARNRAA
jgi:hypothetical protein